MLQLWVHVASSYLKREEQLEVHVSLSPWSALVLLFLSWPLRHSAAKMWLSSISSHSQPILNRSGHNQNAARFWSKAKHVLMRYSSSVTYPCPHRRQESEASVEAQTPLWFCKDCWINRANRKGKVKNAHGSVARGNPTWFQSLKEFY